MQTKKTWFKKGILLQSIKDMNNLPAAVVGRYLYCILLIK